MIFYSSEQYKTHCFWTLNLKGWLAAELWGVKISHSYRFGCVLLSNLHPCQCLIFPQLGSRDWGLNSTFLMTHSPILKSSYFHIYESVLIVHLFCDKEIQIIKVWPQANDLYVRNAHWLAAPYYLIHWLSNPRMESWMSLWMMISRSWWQTS